MIDLFYRLIAEAIEHPGGSFEILAPQQENHTVGKYTWRARIPGRGVYMGRVDEYQNENSETGEIVGTYGDCLVFHWADTFIPEN